MVDALLPLPPEDEIRRLRLQESIDQDWKQRTLEPGVPWDNTERRAAYNLSYRLVHRDKMNAQSRAYHLAHREHRKVTNQVWHQAHREERKAYHLAYNQAMHNEALRILGGICACPGCDECEPRFLTIDHIYGRPKGRRKNAIQEAKASGWDKTKFQLLCWNCNAAKSDRGFCPVHQEDSEDMTIDNQRTVEPGPPLILHCQVCQHEWEFPWERGMLVDAFLARIKGYLACPRCGNKSRARKKAILMLPEKEETE